MVKKPKFYQILTNGRVAEIYIYGDISGDAEIINAIFDVDTGMVSARGIIKEINDLDVDSINVYINSYGGEVAEALAIFSALKRHPAEVHTFCDGFACSAATIIFCAGDVRTMGSIALMMIHNCSMYLGRATAEDMRKYAEDADKINQASINAYMAVTTLSEEEIKTMMSRETWLTAEECLQYGFATDLAEQDPDDEDPEQSAFGSIREAILAHQEDRLTSMDQKLDQILEMMQKEPEPKDPEPTPAPKEPTQKVSFYSRYIRR